MISISTNNQFEIPNKTIILFNYDCKINYYIIYNK